MIALILLVCLIFIILAIVVTGQPPIGSPPWFLALAFLIIMLAIVVKYLGVPSLS